MKRIIFCIMAALFLIGAYFSLHINSGFKVNLMRLLNLDTLYLKNGNVLRGWIWDEKGGLVAGETTQGEIFIFNADEYAEIERDKFLHYLRQLI